MNKVLAYLQAGLDEGIVKFFWGLIATVIVSVVSYTYHHLTGTGIAFLGILFSYLHGSAPVLGAISTWHWAKTTAAATSTVPPVDPLTTEFSGDIPAQA